MLLRVTRSIEPFWLYTPIAPARLRRTVTSDRHDRFSLDGKFLGKPYTGLKWPQQPSRRP